MTTLRVNGQTHELDGVETKLLLHVLQDDLGLTGARGSCGIGMCGTCTVLVDGKALSACLLLSAQVEGKEILTVEGLEKDGQLHTVQQAYIDEFGFQCAYCTPGFILATIAMLEEQNSPDEQTIREYLGGNLCRCGSYVNIVKAVQTAADRLNDT